MRNVIKATFDGFAKRMVRHGGREEIGEAIPRQGMVDTKSSDWLSMLLLVPEYTCHLIETGHCDAARQHAQIAHFLAE